jgi:HK97 family phage major capsid protein
MKKTFQEWCTDKGHEIKEPVLNEDGTVKEEGTSVEDLAKYYNEFNEEKREELASAIKEDVNDANKEAIAELKTELQKGQAEQLKNLNAALKEQGLAIKRIMDKNSGDVSLTNAKYLDESLKEIKDSLTSMKDKRGGTETIKVPGDMTIVGNVSGGNVPVEQRLPGLNRIQRIQTRIRNFVNQGTALSNTISWVEQQNPDGVPAGTAEGTLKNQIDFDLVVVSETVKKRTAFIKVSTEMLDDIDYMRSEIENELFERLDLDVDNQILQGDNTGQNLNGIITQATAFAAGVFAATVNEANLVDVLTVAKNQVVTANFMPTVHIVNPTDMTALKLLKATDNQYVDRLIMVGSTMELDGIPVVEHNGIAQDNFLTMDGSMDTVYSKGEISIQIGLDNDDFTKNMRTILAEWRGLNIIKGNHTPAFVTGVISTAKAALETP